jgi:hypothetical protein
MICLTCWTRTFAGDELTMNLAKWSCKKITLYNLFVRQSIFWVLLFSASTLHTQRFAMAYHAEYSSPGTRSESQTDSAQKTSTVVISGTGVITGKVTIKGKGASDIAVVLRADNFNSNEPPSRKVTTDQEGNYQISNVAPGAYQVAPIAPAFLISGQTGFGSRGFPGTGKSLIIAEGETIQNVDFALTRGGVITGKVTDSDGRPLIEHPINLTVVGKNDQVAPRYPGRHQNALTDDRGIYRVFGLSKGRYRVSAGQSEEGPFRLGPRSSRYRETFYRAVNDPSQATIIEVSEGSEATSIDITVSAGPTNDTFDVSGRIVDGATGKPVPNVRLGLQMGDGVQSSSITTSDWTSNQLGEFKVPNLTPGNYSIYVEQQMNSDFRADPISIEVIDRDVTGLVIKTVRGATVSGLIVFENGDAKVDAVKPGQLSLQTFVQRESQEGGFGRSVSVKPDGSFRIGGLQAGTATFMVTSNVNQGMGFRIMRVERDGVVQLRGIEIKDDEEVLGLRLVVRFGNGSVRGIVRAENGELPAPPRLQVWLTIPGEDAVNSLPTFQSEPKVDSRGHFLFENLPAGTYEVNASVFTSRGTVSTKQIVNVADGVITEVTLQLNLKPNSAAEIK